MPNFRKTVFSTLLATTIAFGGIGMVYASSPAKQEALNKTTVSAVQAIETATAHVAGEATEVDFKHKKSMSYYEVDIIANGQKHEISIDATTGKILGSKAKQDKKAQHRPAIKVSLQQAIGIAQAKTGGKVKEAELKYKSGQPRYKVETLVDGQEHNTIIDANSGQVLGSQIDIG
ncbi:MAG TPA: peptidase [Pasteurellaceae bacterium]|nr:peptidase [Pasteurellaceae bacterium]